jgi:hypothetical protein
VDAADVSVALACAWIAMLVCGLGEVPFFHHETRILLFTLFPLIVNYCPLEPAAGAAASVPRTV